MTTTFVWDTAQAVSNLRRHGVSFETAVRAFSDPMAITEIEDAVFGEYRWRMLATQVTIRIDQDALAWLKSGGSGYQTKLNYLLRKAMQQEQREAKRRELAGSP